MVGAALVRRLATENCEVLTAPRDTVDLTRQEAVERWMTAAKPHAVIVAAAVVGGIHANDSRPVEFLTENLQIETNIIATAHRIAVEKLLFLGSSCIYPRLAPQPINEDALLTGSLEPTNQWYAVAKIAGVKMCQAYRRQHGRDFISCMPTNLYGPGDNFDLVSSHVLPALIVKAHRAKLAGDPTMTLWGSGKPRRELLYVDDCADACVFLLKSYSDDGMINIGWGTDVTIAELAETVAAAVGFKGRFAYDTSKPDGTPRKLLDTTRINAMGWRPKVDLGTGIGLAYRWFLDNVRDAA
jgi:GDP-L-fucose synthase